LENKRLFFILLWFVKSGGLDLLRVGMTKNEPKGNDGRIIRIGKKSGYFYGKRRFFEKYFLLQLPMGVI